MPLLDRQDLDLLTALSRDPRATVVALADALQLSRNTVQARMAKLEREGVFLAFERALTPASIGYPLEAIISVVVRQPDLPRIAEELAEIPEVIQAHGVSGEVDLLVRVAARDAPHLFTIDGKILAIDGIERAETALVMGEVIAYRVQPLIDEVRLRR